MATFIGEISGRQIILVVAVSVPIVQGSGSYRFNALLDTGAQMTMISRKVISQAGLSAIGKMEITPVTGKSVQVNKFRIRLDIPIGNLVVGLPGGQQVPHEVMSGAELEVGTLPYQPNNHDVLLGMDFISHFHITMYNKNFILSN